MLSDTDERLTMLEGRVERLDDLLTALLDRVPPMNRIPVYRKIAHNPPQNYSALRDPLGIQKKHPSQLAQQFGRFTPYPTSEIPVYQSPNHANLRDPLMIQAQYMKRIEPLLELYFREGKKIDAEIAFFTGLRDVDVYAKRKAWEMMKREKGGDSTAEV